MTELTRFLLDLLDVAGFPPELIDNITPELLKSYNELCSLEATSRCKEGRGDSVLHLWTSAGPKPPSKVAFNPKEDIRVGDFVIVKVDVDDSSGQRGWDIGEVVAMEAEEMQVTARLFIVYMGGARVGHVLDCVVHIKLGMDRA